MELELWRWSFLERESKREVDNNDDDDEADERRRESMTFYISCLSNSFDGVWFLEE